MDHASSHAAALEWFKEHCSLNASMEANKAELKEKIAEAKTTGERANKSRWDCGRSIICGGICLIAIPFPLFFCLRSAINYLKGSIEDIRRERCENKRDLSLAEV